MLVFVALQPLNKLQLEYTHTVSFTVSLVWLRLEAEKYWSEKLTMFPSTGTQKTDWVQ